MGKLRECPFCGGNVMIWEAERIGYWFIKCRGCLANMVCDSRSELIRNWNTRVGENNEAD